MKKDPGESSAGLFNADSLREFITERLAAASREVLAAVERTLSAYEEEASGFRLEIRRQRRQLELLQNPVAAGTHDVLSSRSCGSAEEEEGDNCVKIQTQTGSPSASSPQSGHGNPGRPQVSGAQSTIDLSIRVLKDSKISRLSRNAVKKIPLVFLKCPRGLQEADFLTLLRSAVPPLAGGDRPFDTLRLDKRWKLQPLTLKTLTPEVIMRNARSRKPNLYIRLKTQEESTSQRRETSSTSQHPDMETEIQHLWPAISDDDSLAPSADEREGEAVDVNGGGSRKEPDKSGSKKNNDDGSVAVWTIPESSLARFFSCKVCRAAQSSEAALVEHAWTHAEEAGRVCGVCGESFASLREHLKGHSAERPEAGSPRHRCPKRHEALDLQTQLKPRRGTHAKRPKSTSLCGVCGKLLSSNRSLSRHKMTHSAERPHRCPVCQRGFKLATTLKHHEKIHTERQRSHLCDVCCKMYMSAAQLLAHMRSHSGERPYRCELCGRCFGTKGMLSVHMRVHSGEKPFRCPHCSSSFKRKRNLDDHVALHTGARPHVCEVCGKACARKTYLTVHMRTHNGERPYKCSLCEKAFTQGHRLKTHMKSHKGAPPPPQQRSPSAASVGAQGAASDG